MGRVLAVMAMLAGGLLSQPAFACNCPKQQLLEQNGTVSMLRGAEKPRLGPVRPVAPEVAEHQPLDLPLLPPARKIPRYTVDLVVPGGDPLEALLLQP